MKKPRRHHRHEAVFHSWLEGRELKRRGLSLSQFREMCDAGEIPGLGPYDFEKEPSDDEPLADREEGVVG